MAMMALFGFSVYAFQHFMDLFFLLKLTLNLE